MQNNRAVTHLTNQSKTFQLNMNRKESYGVLYFILIKDGWYGFLLYSKEIKAHLKTISHQT